MTIVTENNQHRRQSALDRLWANIPLPLAPSQPKRDLAFREKFLADYQAQVRIEAYKRGLKKVQTNRKIQAAIMQQHRRRLNECTREQGIKTTARRIDETLHPEPRPS